MAILARGLLLLSALAVAVAVSAPARLRRRAQSVGGGASGARVLSAAALAAGVDFSSCGMEHVPLIRSVTPVLNLLDAVSLGSGSYGTVQSGKLPGDARPRRTVVVKSAKKPGTTQCMAEARLEMLMGMVGCSTPEVAPCAAGTPLMRYEGGALYTEPASGVDGVVGIFMQRMTGVSLDKFLDALPAAKLAPVEKEWVDFAATVSPWLYKAAADAADAQAKVVAASRRDVDALLAGVQQVLLGLAHLWDRGVVHRDIKPDNIMVNDGVFTIVDMGAACVYRTAAWSPVELSYLPPALRPFLQNTACLRAATDYRAQPLQCAASRIAGTAMFISPTMSVVSHEEDLRRAQLPAHATCLFNRQACADVTPLDTGAEFSVDTFAVGVTLLEFIAGAHIDYMVVTKLLPMSAKSKVDETFLPMVRSMRIARYLALDDVSAQAADASPANAAQLRARVRARTRALLEVSMSAGADVRTRRAAENTHNVFARQAGEALGIVAKKAADAGAVGVASLKLTVSLARAMADLTKPVTELAMDICPYQAMQPPNGGMTQYGIKCDGTAADRDAQRVAAEPQNAPGTSALLELLANLLSPSKTPGLTRDKTSILALAASIDDVRRQLMVQWQLPGADLAAHLDAVAACTKSVAALTATRTPAEASAHCRWLDLHKPPAAANNNNGKLINGVQVANNGGAAADHAAALQLAIKPEGATVVAVAESARKSDHKPLIKFAWASGTQTRHIAVTEAAGRLYLTYYAPTGSRNKAGRLQPKINNLLELVRVNDAFGKAGAKLPLRAQATLCTIFFEENRANAELVKRVRHMRVPMRAAVAGGPPVARAGAPLSPVTAASLSPSPFTRSTMRAALVLACTTRRASVLRCARAPTTMSCEWSLRMAAIRRQRSPLARQSPPPLRAQSLTSKDDGASSELV